MTIIIFVLITIALLYLYTLFITSDVSIDYVWNHCSSDLPIQYKFAGVLAGMSGSLLFWIWAIITPWFYEEIRTWIYEIRKKDNKLIEIDTIDYTRIGLFSVLAILIFTLSLLDLFKLTPKSVLELSPAGGGLNPLLQTDLMVIHPPVVFLAYGFLVIPFAAAFSNLVTGRKDWINFSFNWSRLGWILLTLGIGIGALWAYVVLGWGGYWAWDPVETSSLIPWIILTGFLHCQLMYKRKNDFKLMTPILGIFTFILVIFATFVTRAGGIWVSVHTFGEAEVSINAWQRFINILGENQTILTYFIFMIICIIITTILILHRNKIIKKSEEKKEDQLYTLSELINDELLMLVTIVLFIITTIVTLILLIVGVNGWDPNVYNSWIGFLCLIISLIMIFCLIWRYIGRLWISIMCGFIIILSVVSYFITANNIAFASLPVLLFVLIASIYKIIKSFNMKKPWKSMRLVSAHLIHLAIIFIFIGYVSSNYFVEDKTMYLSVGDNGGQIGDYTIKLISGKTYSNEGYVVIEVWRGNDFIGKENPGWILLDGQTRNEIKIVDTLFEDVYLIYQQAYGDDPEIVEAADIEVKILPQMKILWLGMWLLAFGMFLRIVAEMTVREKPKIETLEKYEDVVGIKDDRYYEDILESELKK